MRLSQAFLDPRFETIALFDVENVDERCRVRLRDQARHLSRYPAIVPTVRNEYVIRHGPVSQPRLSWCAGHGQRVQARTAFQRSQEPTLGRSGAPSLDRAFRRPRALGALAVVRVEQALAQPD